MPSFFEAMGCDPADVADYTPAVAPVVSRMLELSTAHVPDGDAYSDFVLGLGLTRPDGDMVRTEILVTDQTPDWLKAIVAHAVALDCEWIDFDADGPIDPALPFWKW